MYLQNYFRYIKFILGVKFLLLCCGLLLSQLAWTQSCILPPPSNLISNASFESSCIVNEGETLNGAFNTGCVDGWGAAMNTPSICNSVLDQNMQVITAFDGDQFACIRSVANVLTGLCDQNEAFFTPVSLCKGVKYKISFSYINLGSTLGLISVYLTQGLVNNPSLIDVSNCYPVGNPPSQPIGLQPVGNNQVWQTKTIVFSTNNVNLNQIVFYCNTESSNQFVIGFDKIEVICDDSPLIPSISHSINNCNAIFNGSTTSSIPEVLPQSWCWDFGDGTTANGQNVTHSYLQSGTYPVCLSVSDNCGGCIEQVCTTVTCEIPNPVCICSGSNSINIDATSANPKFDPNLGGTLYSDIKTQLNLDPNNDGKIDGGEHGGCISINGRLIIDRTLTIDGANIKMFPCSEILINKQNTSYYPTLILDFNQIFGCIMMWKGITVGNNCRLEMHEGSIKDAEFAVRVPGAADFGIPFFSSLEVEDVVFYKNHVGIYLGRSGTQSWVTHLPLQNNTFTGGIIGQTLLPSCTPSLPNYDQQQGYAGIVSQSLTSTNIGSSASTSYSNFFKNIYKGYTFFK